MKEKLQAKLPWILVLTIAVVYMAVLASNAPQVGFTRDEGYYFKAAQQYGGWWDTLFSKRFLEAFTDAEIRSHFSYNTEHPALVKLSQGITHRVLHQWFALTTPSTGYRWAGFLFAGLSVLATFLLGRALVNTKVGIIAALLLATMPRYFFDAHLACFDVPITAMWTLSLWAFWRAWQARETSNYRKHTLVAAVVFGLALATKLNALFLPFVFVGLWLWTGRVFSSIRWTTGPSGSKDIVLPTIPWVLIACAIIGPLVFIAHWPYVWHDTFNRIGAYIGFHLHHEHYPASYFFDVLVKPPFPIHFPFVMGLFTIPAPILVLAVIGLGLSVWRALVSRSPQDTLLVLAAMIPMMAIALPSSPIFGGVKHWYNALPLLAILAARSALAGVEGSLPKKTHAWATVGLVALMALPGMLGIAASPATGIGFYNEIAGGYRGGAELGMQRGFWGGLARPSYDRLKDLPPGSRVFFNRTNYDSYRMYTKEGVIPSHVYYSNDARRISAAVHFEQPEHGEKEGEIWSSLGTRPVAGTYADNVTLTQMYEKGASSGPPPSE